MDAWTGLFYEPPVHSLFDSAAFNERLFFPGGERSPRPIGAHDRMIEVPGAELHARWHKSVDAKVTILLFHGNGEVVADYDGAARHFAAAGAELMVVDFRGYGQSSGRPTLRDVISDATGIVRGLSAELRQPLVVMGRSVGSACAAELYGAGLPMVRGVIWESGSVDLGGLAQRRGLTLPADEDHSFFDPRPKLRRGTLPLLVLHGAEDAIISVSEGREAAAIAGGSDKTLVVIPERGHNNVASSERYWEAIATFVDRIKEAAG